MTPVRTVLTLHVSEYLFRLMTEAVRLHSNRTGRFASLACVIEAHSGEVRAGFEHHELETLRGHFITIPTGGDVCVEVELGVGALADIQRARVCLANQLNESSAEADTLSALLFDYVVEEKATGLLGKLGLAAHAPSRGIATERPSRLQPVQTFTRP